MLAHEVAHIRNRDTYLMTVATVFAGVIALVADLGFRSIAYGGRSRKGGWLVLVLAIVGFILAPYAALLLRMSLSRRREFLADASAAEILNDPEAMALALRRLERDPTRVAYADTSTAHLWVESPTDRLESERPGVLSLARLFNTHPAIDARIAALEEAGGFRLPEQLPGYAVVRERARPRVAPAEVPAQTGEKTLSFDRLPVDTLGAVKKLRIGRRRGKGDGLPLSPLELALQPALADGRWRSPIDSISRGTSSKGWRTTRSGAR